MARVGTNDVIGGGGLHHIAMNARDFDGTVRFYTEGLGFRAAYAWGTLSAESDSRAVMLDMGDGNYLEVFSSQASHAGNGAILHFALRSLDAEAAYHRALAAGAVSQVEPKTVAVPGQPPRDFRIAFVRGPEGETIEFFQNDAL